MPPADAQHPADSLPPNPDPHSAVSAAHSAPGSAASCSPTCTPLSDAACGSPISREAIGAAEAAALAHTLKAIADPTRLRLISMVAAHTDSEACVCDLTRPLGLSQGTVSHHLKVLVDARIFARTKRGTWAYYRLVPGALAAVAGLVVTV